ncbi:class II aldolase/adducin family protein, partial [Serratia sp. IR-2025]
AAHRGGVGLTHSVTPRGGGGGAGGAGGGRWGYYMLWGGAPPRSHLDSVAIPIFDNDQDIPRLAARVAAYAEATPLQYGFLVRGHGLYCWGSQVAEARRHLEGLEFLFQCELQRRLLEAK